MSRREDLMIFIRNARPELSETLDDDTRLISSGLFDSLTLFNLTLWVEARIDAPINPATFDFLSDWDTPAGILRYIERELGK